LLAASQTLKLASIAATPTEKAQAVKPIMVSLPQPLPLHETATLKDLSLAASAISNHGEKPLNPLTNANYVDPTRQNVSLASSLPSPLPLPLNIKLSSTSNLAPSNNNAQAYSIPQTEILKSSDSITPGPNGNDSNSNHGLNKAQNVAKPPVSGVSKTLGETGGSVLRPMLKPMVKQPSPLFKISSPLPIHRNASALKKYATLSKPKPISTNSLSADSVQRANNYLAQINKNQKKYVFTPFGSVPSSSLISKPTLKAPKSSWRITPAPEKRAAPEDISSPNKKIKISEDTEAKLYFSKGVSQEDEERVTSGLGSFPRYLFEKVQDINRTDPSNIVLHSLEVKVDGVGVRIVFDHNGGKEKEKEADKKEDN